MIFNEQISRKPDYYPWTQSFKEMMQNGHWTVQEFSFATDLQDFKNNMDEQTRTMVVRGLSTIGQLEIAVKKFWAKLGENLPHPSISDMGFVMAYTEVVHGDAYERLLEVLGLEDSFDEILKLDIIKGRVNYLRKHLHKFHSDNKRQFIYSLILFTLFVENIALFSQFYMIAYFGRFHNILKDTNKQIEYTSREENIHALIGIKLINVIRSEYPELFDEALEAKILEEAENAVRYESQIIEWILNGFSDDYLNKDLLVAFIEDRMNSSLEDIGYKKIFNPDQDLVAKTRWFDEQLIAKTKTDFFHSRPVEYSKPQQSFDPDELF